MVRTRKVIINLWFKLMYAPDSQKKKRVNVCS